MKIDSFKNSGVDKINAGKSHIAKFERKDSFLYELNEASSHYSNKYKYLKNEAVEKKPLPDYSNEIFAKGHQSNVPDNKNIAIKDWKEREISVDKFKVDDKFNQQDVNDHLRDDYKYSPANKPKINDLEAADSIKDDRKGLNDRKINFKKNEYNSESKNNNIRNDQEKAAIANKEVENDNKNGKPEKAAVNKESVKKVKNNEQSQKETEVNNKTDNNIVADNKENNTSKAADNNLENSAKPACEANEVAKSEQKIVTEGENTAQITDGAGKLVSEKNNVSDNTKKKDESTAADKILAKAVAMNIPNISEGEKAQAAAKDEKATQIKNEKAEQLVNSVNPKTVKIQQETGTKPAVVVKSNIEQPAPQNAEKVVEQVQKVSQFDNAKVFVRVQQTIEANSQQNNQEQVNININPNNQASGEKVNIGTNGENGNQTDQNNSEENSIFRQLSSKNPKDGEIVIAKAADNTINIKLDKNQPVQAKTVDYYAYSKIKPEQFSRKTMQIIKNLPAGSTSSARLILKPESLGTIFVEIKMLNKAVSLKLKANSGEALKTIENQLPALKQQLAQQGLRADKIEVEPNNYENDFQGAFRDGSKNSENGNFRTRQKFLDSFLNLKENETTEDAFSSTLRDAEFNTINNREVNRHNNAIHGGS